jgi:hypothetical protein
MTTSTLTGGCGDPDKALPWVAERLNLIFADSHGGTLIADPPVTSGGSRARFHRE